jgi:flagellar biosynthetic protein FliR
MISVTSTQLDLWLAALVFPLTRILGLIAAAPLFSNQALPLRVRVALGMVLAIAVVPALPPAQGLVAGSWMGVLALLREAFIGISIGFMMRIVFACVDVAGELVGLQMGLSFATFFDPENAAQTSVLAEFMGLISSLLFLALDGHLMLIRVLVESFQWLPVGGTTELKGWGYVAHYGITLFAAGFMIAMPLVAALLITNIALGVLTRAAPQLNLFAVGFPVTLSAGFITLFLSLQTFGPVMRTLYERGFESVALLLRALSGS